MNVKPITATAFGLVSFNNDFFRITNSFVFLQKTKCVTVPKRRYNIIEHFVPIIFNNTKRSMQRA